MERLYQLVNKNGKSINNAIVKEYGTTSMLYSYNTPVCEVHHGSAFIRFYKEWDYSVTTLKHIKAFLYHEIMLDKLTKDDIQKAIDDKKIYIFIYNTTFDVQFIK